MKRLLSLGQKELMSGLNGGGYFNEVGGLWQAALGMNPFIQSDALTGLVAGCATAVDIGAGVIGTDYILAGASRVTGSNTGTLYMLGSGGKIYYVSLTGGDNILTDAGHTTAVAAANGMAIFRVGANEHLYYFQTTQIGRYDLITPAYVDNWTGGLQNTTHHPAYPFLDRLFFGNGYYVGVIKDDGAGAVSTSLTALNLPPDYTVTCLADDGQYLVIGATKNKDTNSNPAGLSAETKILFWDTNSSSWQKEYELPFSAYISGMKKVGSTIYAVTNDGIYAFNFGSYPKLVRELSNTTGLRFGMPSGIDQFRDSVVFGNQLTMIGHPASYAQKFGVYAPFLNPEELNGNISFIWTNPRINRILLSTTNGKVYRINTITNGAPSQVWQTKLMDLKARYQIMQIEILLGNVLASGDAINVSVLDDALTATTFDGVSFATHGAVSRVVVTPGVNASPDAELVGLQLQITGGVPTILKINVYGEEVVQV